MAHVLAFDGGIGTLGDRGRHLHRQAGRAVHLPRREGRGDQPRGGRARDSTSRSLRLLRQRVRPPDARAGGQPGGGEPRFGPAGDRPRARLARDALRQARAAAEDRGRAGDGGAGRRRRGLPGGAAAAEPAAEVPPGADPGIPRAMEDKEPQNDEQEAAQADEGQDQEPKQADDDSASVFDTDEHSDAPGPFGTGLFGHRRPQGRRRRGTGRRRRPLGRQPAGVRPSSPTRRSTPSAPPGTATGELTGAAGLTRARPPGSSQRAR